MTTFLVKLGLTGHPDDHRLRKERVANAQFVQDVVDLIRRRSMQDQARLVERARMRHERRHG